MESCSRWGLKAERLQVDARLDEDHHLLGRDFAVGLFYGVFYLEHSIKIGRRLLPMGGADQAPRVRHHKGGRATTDVESPFPVSKFQRVDHVSRQTYRAMRETRPRPERPEPTTLRALVDS